MRRKMITILMSVALCFTVPQAAFATEEVPAEIPVEAEDPAEESFEAAEDPFADNGQGITEVPETGITGPDAPQISESYPDEELVGAAQSYTFTITYGQTEARSMLDMVNSFRTGSDAWYWNEDNATKTYCKGLPKLTYDYQLEKVAMIRAAEVAVAYGHTRPNLTDCFTAYTEQGYSHFGAGENIAAGQRTAEIVYTDWREDNEDYDGQGHRRNMLDADFNRIGIAHVMLGGVHYWVQEFAVSNSSITTTAANDSSTSVEVQIDESKITSSTIQTSVSSIKLAEKESCALPTASISLSVSGHWGSALEADANCRWSVSNTSIAKISGSSLVGVSQGSTSLKATVNGQTVTIPVTVNHVPVTDPAVPATCTKTGLTTGSHCSVCGAVITAQKTVPKKEHTPATDPAVPATCTKTGLTAGSHCSVCNTIITAQKTVPKKEHTPATDPAVPATCTKTGLTEGSHCSVCGTVITAQETVPTIAHKSVTDPAVPATCTKTGLTAGSHCSVCGKIIKAQKTVPMIAHTPVTDPAVPATCSKTGLTEGSHCSVCDTVITAQETVPKIAHKSVTDPAVPATCSKTGLTKGSHCSVCGTVITAQKTVPKIAHTPETDPAVKPTCTSSGLTEGSHCSVCGTIITAQKKVNALGHEWGEWTVTKEATYDRAGEKQRVCSRDSSHIETDEIPKLVKSGFSDVQDQKHPYYKAIYWAAGVGITKGYPDGTFGINKSCTRGEMIMFLWRYVGKPAPKASSKSPFKDVPTNHTFYKAILWGSQKGITKGYSDGSFGINRNVTRGEAMMFLWRLKGKPAPKAAATSPFKDVPTNHVFYKAILWGSQKKVTTGYTSGPNSGKFMINDNCTRGQIVTFLYRAK